jgi:transcriptional regulator with GAF, ATPase, and Fis domain
MLLPPLRERGEDVLLLAEAFIDRFARRMGRRIAPLTAADKLRLKSYRWPGNVRELQNVTERAVITAQNGRLDLSRGLPDSPAEPARPPAPGAPFDENRVFTDAEIKEHEKQNILKALETAGWRVSGQKGAARLLGIPASTLNSRIKSFGIKMPR